MYYHLSLSKFSRLANSLGFSVSPPILFGTRTPSRQVGWLHLRAERRGPCVGGDHSSADPWFERQERGGEAHLLSAPW